MFFRYYPEKFWNLLANRYAASPIDDKAAYTEKIHNLKTYLSSDDIVLDIGCGTGTQCCDIARSVNQVIGIDISSKLLSIAEQRKIERKLTNIRYMQTRFSDERFQAESFDVVMVFYMLHFVKDIDAAFARIRELLKPGGLFISETACLGERGKLLGGMLRLAGMLGFLPPIYLLTTDRLEQALKRADFTLVEKTKFGSANHDYTLIAKKN